jgi:trans-2,3-dihydro-3-hydroxyanthranilate isomerase
VLPNAEGLSAEQMQKIAREIQFLREHVRVSGEGGPHAPRSGSSRRRAKSRSPVIRMSAPRSCSRAPASSAAFRRASRSKKEAGLVPIAIQADGGKVTHCELAAPQAVSFGKTIAPERVAAAISLTAADIVTTTHAPQVASVGLPFVITELKDRATLGRARANPAAFESLLAEDVRPSLHFYAHAKDGFDIRARMFAPLSGVPRIRRPAARPARWRTARALLSATRRQLHLAHRAGRRDGPPEHADRARREESRRRREDLGRRRLGPGVRRSASP